MDSRNLRSVPEMFRKGPAGSARRHVLPRTGSLRSAKMCYDAQEVRRHKGSDEPLSGEMRLGRVICQIDSVWKKYGRYLIGRLCHARSSSVLIKSEDTVASGMD